MAMRSLFAHSSWVCTSARIQVPALLEVPAAHHGDLHQHRGRQVDQQRRPAEQPAPPRHRVEDRPECGQWHEDHRGVHDQRVEGHAVDLHGATVLSHPVGQNCPIVLAPMPTDYTDDLRLAHVLADDADSVSQSRYKALDLHVMTKPDLTPVTDADESVEVGIRRTLSRARPRDAVLGEETGSTGPQPAALGGRPDRRHQELRPGRPRLGHPDLADGRRRGRGRRGLGPHAQPALVGDDGRRRLDRQVAAAGHGVPGLRRLPDRGRLAVLLLAARAGTSAAGSTTSSRCRGGAGAPGRTATSGATCSLAEGAVDIATEPELELHDMAALEVIVREAGGVFTSLDGEPGPDGRQRPGHQRQAARPGAGLPGLATATTTSLASARRHRARPECSPRRPGRRARVGSHPHPVHAATRSTIVGEPRPRRLRRGHR